MSLWNDKCRKNTKKRSQMMQTKTFEHEMDNCLNFSKQ